MVSEQEAKLREPWIRLIEKQKDIRDRYFDVKRISSTAGDGQFSLVFKAKDRLQKKESAVALKFFSPLALSDRYRYEAFHRESRILSEFKGQPNILPLIEGKTELALNLGGVPFLLIFYSTALANSSIQQYIYDNEKLDWLKNILYFREMCKAIRRIHDKTICHRDLHPGNFLVFEEGDVRLGDFGTARHFDDKSRPILDSYSAPVGHLRYVAPELLGGLYFSNRHNFSADIYSLGAILFELFTKTILSSYIFVDTEIRKFSSYFYRIPEKDRMNVFDEFIEGFSKDRVLPSIREFEPAIQKTVAQQIDMLYRSLAALDYRKRAKDFQRIFSRINICEKVIRNLMKIEKWKKNRKERDAKFKPGKAE